MQASAQASRCPRCPSLCANAGADCPSTLRPALHTPAPSLCPSCRWPCAASFHATLLCTTSSAGPAPTPCPCSCRPSRRPRRHAPALAVVRHAARQLCRYAGRPGPAPSNALAGHAAWLRCSKTSEGHPALIMPPYPCTPAGRRSLAPAAIAAPERTSVYESIKQNSEFPPETAVRSVVGPRTTLVGLGRLEWSLPVGRSCHASL